MLCLLMMVTFTLTGCAGFSIYTVRYYNEVVATVGETEITRFELLNAYSSYGQTYYVEQMGLEPIEALSNTLDLLIDREILYQYALSEEKYALTDRQVNDVVQAIFDSIDSQMESYVTSAKTILFIVNSFFLVTLYSLFSYSPNNKSTVRPSKAEAIA